MVGVHDAQVLQHEVAEQCKQMEPEVRPLMTVAEYENKYIVAAEIPGADISERPVYYRGAGRIRGSFIRSGEADEPMSEYEVYSLEAFKHRIHDDIRTMDETPGTRYREELIAEYLRKLRQKSRHLRDIASDIEIQELMGIRKDGKPTLAGILNFGVYPQAVFPRLCVTAIVVPGETVGDTGEQGERFLANETINGTLTEMLEDALAFVERNQRIRTVIDENGRRNDCPEFPLKAVREVVLNALIHRDYSSYSEGTPIMLAMYKDRMEVINKGGLYGRVSVSRLGFTHPDTRNPSIAGIMETLDQTENRYSGIPTIRAEMKKANLREPVFQSKNGEFKVILYNSEKNAIQPAETGNLSPKERKLLEFCSIPRTRTEISQHMGSTWTNVKNGYISRLISSGLLRMTKPETPKVRDQQFVAIYRLFQDEQMNGQFVQNEI